MEHEGSSSISTFSLQILSCLIVDQAGCLVKKYQKTLLRVGIQRLNYGASVFKNQAYLLFPIVPCCQVFISGDWYPGVGGADWSMGLWDGGIWGDIKGLLGLSDGAKAASPCWPIPEMKTTKGNRVNLQGESNYNTLCCKLDLFKSVLD